MIEFVLPAYGLQQDELVAEEFGTGLINNTWKITAPGRQYILQRINNDVFKKPNAIAENIGLIAEYLKLHHPQYLFAAPCTTTQNKSMVYVEGKGYFRLFPFIEGSHSFDVAATPEIAYEAAAQFGKFTSLLAGFDASKLNKTIPHFHNLSLRYQQFNNALITGNKERILKSTSSIDYLIEQNEIVTQYDKLCNDSAFKQRVTHHDTKISNVLFNGNNKGIAVIDLDTVMPGYFISDVGDMMRTYLSPVSEEETDLSKIEVRDEFYKAIVQGYSSYMKNLLTEKERLSFFYAGRFMIYMQALRFLTDYINDDIYYGAKYEGQNLRRAQNQIVLLKRLLEKEKLLTEYSG